MIPLYKGGDVTCINNYRPVSILPTFSKIFERIMHKRLMSFITKHNILYKFQFGFRQNYSRNMALIHLIDKIMSSIDNANFVIGIFLNLTNFKHRLYISVLEQARVLILIRYVLLGVINTIYKHCHAWVILWNAAEGSIFWTMDSISQLWNMS